MFFVLESSVPSQAQSLTLTGSSVLNWFNTNASSVYQSYMNNLACPIAQSSAAYQFCLEDTILSQSPLLGQVTVKSADDYQTAVRVLSNTKIKSY